jgi:hypothetical protein
MIVTGDDSEENSDDDMPTVVVDGTSDEATESPAK